MAEQTQQENILLVLPFELPKGLLDQLRKDFPGSKVTSYLTERQKNSNNSRPAFEVPDDVWRDATVISTIFSLPPRADLAPKLKYVHMLSAGVDQITDGSIYKDTKIPITTSSGIHGPPIAEWVLMATLALTKNYNVMYENQKQGKWDSRAPGLLKTHDWYGKTVGICGYGKIGRHIAKVYAAMGSKIHAFTASPRNTQEQRRDTGYFLPGTGDVEGTLPDAWYNNDTGGGGGKVGLHNFLASGLDMLIVSVPLTKHTRGLFGKEELDILYTASLEKSKRKVENDQSGTTQDDTGLDAGEGCIFVNISRGPIVETSALMEALKAKKLMGAALDVTDPEPLPEGSELWHLDNIVITPHISAHGVEYWGRAIGILDKNLRRLEKGERLLNEVNRDRGY